MAKRGSGLDQTFSMATEWTVEVFDWSPDFPQGSPIFPMAESQDHYYVGEEAVLTTVEEAKTSNVGGLLAQAGAGNFMKGGSPKVLSGLSAVTFSRSKARVDSQCNLVFVGPLPKPVRAGNWVLVSSLEQVVVANKKPDTEKKDKKLYSSKFRVLTRFIGQIHSVRAQYVTQANGNITQVSTIAVQEWSASLLAPVRFDLRSVHEALTAEGSLNVAASIASKVSSKGGGELDGILKAVNETMNPYTCAKAFLFMVGGLNKSASLPASVKPLKNVFDVAITMPDVPKKLLERIGMANVSPAGAFQDGFATVIAGRQNGPIPGEPLVGDGFLFSIKSMAASFKDFLGDQKLQPVAYQAGTLMQLGQSSAWQLIASRTDPSMNEAYTDILYERSGTQIVARPVIFVRGMPFKTKAAEKLMSNYGALPKDKSIYDTWTYFEDVPRVRIASALITSLSLDNTILSSPNYVYPDYHATDGNVKASYGAQFGAMFHTKLDAEMRRFGGHVFSVPSQYYFSGGGEATWADTRKVLGINWKSFEYRTASGSLTIKDSSIPLTLGMNIQFTIGSYELVAQIEAISVSFRINPSGTKEATTSISFSRLMYVPDIKKPETLDFLPAGAMGDLWSVLAPPAKPASVPADGGLPIDWALNTTSGLIPGLS